MDSFNKVDESFRFVYSSSINSRIQIKIGTLEGLHNYNYKFQNLFENPLLRFSGLYSSNDIYKCAFKVQLQVFNKGKSLCLPVNTSYKPFTSRWNWNEWITLPLLYSDVPKTAILAITIFDCSGPGQMTTIGGTAISLFGRNSVFRQGLYDLRVWSFKESDGNENTSTPGKDIGSNENKMQRLAKLAKMHRNGRISKIDWLDRLTFREIELINQNEKEESAFLFLMIEFPTVSVGNIMYTVIYYEPEGDTKFLYLLKPKLYTIPDTEVLQENLVEQKHHKLARSARTGLSDKDSKPTASERNLLNKLVFQCPPTYNMTSEELDLVWKYRFYLKDKNKALAKFLKCISWKTQSEVRQALSLLAQWAPMDVEDALELLTPAFKHPAVRRYAISRLNQASDEDLLLYLLQLVQALKYENVDEILKINQTSFQDEIIYSFEEHSISESENSGEKSPLSTYKQETGKEDNLPPHFFTNENVTRTDQSELGLLELNTWNTSSGQNLATFLINRSCKNENLASYLYWYISIECEEHDTTRKQNLKVKEMYITVQAALMKALSNGTEDLKNIYCNLKKQQQLLKSLVEVVKQVSKESGNRRKKIDKFQLLLNDADSFKINFLNFEPRPFPLDPSVWIKGIVPQKVTLFKSALMPAKLSFVTTNNQEYVAIFKYGDDLRQDQLILQMITLMDKLLRKDNLDLKLTPYRVLATSSKHGFMQYIESTTVAEVLASEGSILNFLKKHNPNETATYGITPEVIDNYINSCAGYAIITYILGVGDRHLDNLLLTKNGKLFHIDFGYILGRDPKPLPPPMKLSKEVFFDGITSEHYHDFKKQCYTAFLHLRRHANVMLNLFSLMIDASIPDIALEPDKAVKKVEKNLQLSLSDEEAVQFLQNLIDISMSAVMPALVEQIHKFAQYWRK